jgi:parallel beta-helix repeat protein
VYDGTVEINAQDIQLDKCGGVVVTGNHMYNPRATGNRYGIYMTYCNESVVSDNFMTAKSGSLGYVVGVWMCDCFTSKINGNFINYANTGIRSGQTIDGVARLQIIRNNVLRNITVLGIDVTDAGDSMTISDNIISCSAPVTCVSTSPAFSQCTIKNNVLYTKAPVAIS